MTTPHEAPSALHASAEGFTDKEDVCGEEPSDVEISRELCAELLDPRRWDKTLETFAYTMKMAVALADTEGRLLGKCHNPQATWRLVRGSRPQADGECPFCLGPPAFCNAVAEALRTGTVVTVEDQAGLAHVAVPLSLGRQQLGALIAGQVFSHYPEPLPLQRAAKHFGISSQQLWQQAIQELPIAPATLQLYADLLMALGQALLGQLYGAIVNRKLAQTTHRYRLFIDAAKDYAIFTLDRDGRVTSWSSGAEHLFGYTEAEIMGRHHLDLVDPQNFQREKLEQAMSEAASAASIDYESWRIRKDGTRFLAAGVLSSMGEGDAREYGALIRDVTERRQSEEALRHAQKLEGIGVFAGGIAHDFNNLLTGIMGGLSLIKTSLPLDNPAYPVVEIAEQSSARAAELIAQLLAYAGKGQFVITCFDFSALISDMMPLIASSIPKTVNLELSLPPGLPWIEADATQIRQIVMNLVINGAEAIGSAVGTVRVATGLSSSAHEIFMEVRDSGSGMSEATKAKMFDPFFTTKFTGRGLGLAAVSGIVRSHKGRMHVDSSPGQGTTFKLYFPAVKADVRSAVDLPSSIVPCGTGTILVVDDEPSLRQLARLILEQSGYSVLVAEDGREGLEIFRQNAARITAVLLDITMPVMGGHEALRLIREIRPDVPIVMSSGYSETTAREELAHDEVAGFVHKPWVPAKLVENIQSALKS